MANEQPAPTNPSQENVVKDAPSPEDTDPVDQRADADRASTPPSAPEPPSEPSNQASGEDSATTPQKPSKKPSQKRPRWLIFPKVPLPKIRLPQWRPSWVQLLLLLMAFAYVVVSQQFILLIYKKRFLAISGMVVSLILPLVTAYAEYTLMRWGYLISGVLVMGGLILIAKSPMSWILVALVTWLGLLSMVISGEILTKQKVRLWLVVVIHTLIAVAAMGLGWVLVWLMS